MRVRRWLSVGLSVVLLVELGAQAPAQAESAAERLTPQRYDSVDGRTASAATPVQSATERAARHRRPAAAWPTSGAVEVAVPTGGSASTSTTARIGGLPVSVSRPAAGRTAAPTKVRVAIATRAETDAAGVRGVLLRVSRADGASSEATARVEVDYSAFAGAYGGDWASRLGLVALAGCTETETERKGCTAQPLPSRNHTGKSTVAADVPVGSTQTLVALMAGPSGGAGSFAETSLASSSTWGHSGSTGGFTWAYPMRTPPAIGGPAPTITLAYSSQSVDGRHAASNNQPSWVGEGFEFSPGFIERRYTPCKDDTGNGANNGDETGDLCWDSHNAVMSLGGNSVELLRGSDGRWHPRQEDASRIELKVDGTNGNGDDNGEYWRVTTANGTQYFFGRHKLPGWSTNRPTTNSVLTVPVAGNHSGEPCYSSSFVGSFCNQAWRWNLDYVVDVNGNTMSLWYGRESNHYARNRDMAHPVRYDRSGHLLRIDYGSENRGGTEYGATSPYVRNTPARVEFDVADRCASACTNKDADHWPDVPWELECTATETQCLMGTPTFWSSKRLATVTTKVWRAASSAYQSVDEWRLRHTYPDPGDATRAGLWLAGITHRGLNGTAVALPEVTLDGIQLNNRVDATGEDWAPAMNWWRLNRIVSETGGETFVTYSPAQCKRGGPIPTKETADSNTLRCFPVIWTPQGHTTELTDWFHTYVVEEVKQYDHHGGAYPLVTRYRYENPANLPLWRYDDDSIVPAKRKSWSQWRGYPTVIQLVGEGAAQTKTETLYFRGMHGDRLRSGSTRSVTVTDREGGTATDHDHFAGMPREQIVWLGSSILSATVTDPWRSEPTVSRGGTPAVEARYAAPATTPTRTALGGGGWRRTTSTTTYDGYGMAVSTDDRGDESTGQDDRCSVTEYARNTTGDNWLLTPARRAHGWVGRCASAPTSAIEITADTRFSFDGGQYGATPNLGRVTEVQEIKAFTAGTPTYQTTSTTGYDAYGRITETTDVAGEKTTTGYEPATGGPVTRIVTTNPLGWTEATDLDPAWGSPLLSTDANSRVTETVYDALGRATGTWTPDRRRSVYPDQPTTRYAYQVSKTATSAVTVENLNPGGGYTTTYAIVDSLGRQRQTQTPAYGGGRVISDTFYDSAGRVWKSNPRYYNNQAAGTALFLATDADVPSQVRTSYDAAGRASEEALYSRDVKKWASTTSYHGDHTTLIPPEGAAASTVWTDARGNTTKLWQYHGRTPSGGYDETRYTYHPTGRLATVVDASGNTWRYDHDILGRPTRVDDPDKGTTTFTYNSLNQLETSTDSRQVTRGYTYDRLGRLLTVRDGGTTGAKRAEWVYDTPAKGLTRSASRWIGSNEYRTETVTVDALYRPTQSRVIIPAVEGRLAGTYTFKATYHNDGSPNTVTLPATGALPAEKLTYRYDTTYGLPNQLETDAGGGSYYVIQAAYTNLFEPNVTTRATALTGANIVQTGQYYQEDTGRVSRRPVLRSVSPSYISNTHYSYDAAGNVTTIDDNPVPGTGQRDMQCFTYDHQRRLTNAWTPASADCGRSPSEGLGGPAPYRQSWGFGAPDDPKGRVGNRLSQTDHATPDGEVTTTYTYPNAGDAQPHTLLGYARTTATGTSTGMYRYDQAGNTTSRPGPNGQQSLTWDADGHLAEVADEAGRSNYVYDADGNRLISNDATSATLHLAGLELRLTKSTGSIATTRYYTFNGETVAQRTDAGITWLAADHHGTGDTTVGLDAAQTVTRRRQTPYGTPRGAEPAWPNPRGFVGGYRDPTGLTHLGAREYDSATGRFASVDPLIDASNPQQIHGYSYAGNNPVTFSDPDGLIYTDFLDQPDPHFGNNERGNCNSAYDCQRKADRKRYGHTPHRIGKGKYDPLKEFFGELACSTMGWCGPVLVVADGVDLYYAVQEGDTAAIIGSSAGFIPGCLAKICNDGVEALVKNLLARAAKGVAENVLTTAAKRAADDVAERAGQRTGTPWRDPRAPDAPKAPKEAGGGGGTGPRSRPDSPGPSCRHSFAPGTQVLMADGDTKPIEQVTEGDEVLAHDPESTQTSAEQVTALHVNRDTELTDLTVRTEAGSVELHTTAHHPFWSESRQDWINAADLWPGERLSTMTGSATVAVVDNHTGAATMRDLTVDRIHTYYVLAGKTPVLVHNTGGCIPALRSWQSERFQFGNQQFLLDKKGMEHILTRHHPAHWDGSVKAQQSFFDRSMSVEDVQGAIGSVMRQNRDTLVQRGGRGMYQIQGNVNGVDYVLGVNNGRVGQFYPLPGK